MWSEMKPIGIEHHRGRRPRRRARSAGRSRPAPARAGWAGRSASSRPGRRDSRSRAGRATCRVTSAATAGASRRRRRRRCCGPDPTSRPSPIGMEWVTKISRADAAGAPSWSRACLGRVHRGGDEARVVGVVPDPVDLQVGAPRGVEEVLPVLPAGGVGRVGAGHHREHPPVSVRLDRGASRRPGTGPSCGCPSRAAGSDRAASNSSSQRREQRATLIVDRAPAPEQEVVLTDLGEPLPGNASAAGDVLQERHHVLRPLGPAEGDQQDRVVRCQIRRLDGRAGGRSASVEVGAGIVSSSRSLHHGQNEYSWRKSWPRGFARIGQVLADPAARAFSLAGLIARLPLSMTGLGIVLLVSLTTGSFGRAGLVAAVGTIVRRRRRPAVGPVDRPGRPGPGAALRPRSSTRSAWSVADHLRQLGWPLAVSLAAAVGRRAGLLLGRGGGPRPMDHRLAGVPLLNTAFALEAMLDEVVFIVGPVLVDLPGHVGPSRARLARRPGRSGWPGPWPSPPSAAPSPRYAARTTPRGRRSAIAGRHPAADRHGQRGAGRGLRRDGGRRRRVRQGGRGPRVRRSDLDGLGVRVAAGRGWSPDHRLAGRPRPCASASARLALAVSMLPLPFVTIPGLPTGVLMLSGLAIAPTLIASVPW